LAARSLSLGWIMRTDRRFLGITSTLDRVAPLFDDPILAQSALDRLAHNAHQVALEVDSFSKFRPFRRGKVLSREGRPLPKEDEVAPGDAVATMGSRVLEEVRRP